VALIRINYARPPPCNAHFTQMSGAIAMGEWGKISGTSEDTPDALRIPVEAHRDRRGSSSARV
jgi:hypothetical protein